jgi:hypothetical protein
VKGVKAQASSSSSRRRKKERRMKISIFLRGGEGV